MLSPPRCAVHTTGSCFADQHILRKPGTSQFCEVFSPLRCASARGEPWGQLQPHARHRAPLLSTAAAGHLTLQAVGVELDVALAAAGSFDDHLDAVPLDAGQGLGASARSCRTWGFSMGAESQWGSDPVPLSLPFLGTNCDVTPTSKVAKTGEWSLVTMSSVQPGMGRGS